jgi:HJR/Mrr/RecB family endonuclease
VKISNVFKSFLVFIYCVLSSYCRLNVSAQSQISHIGGKRDVEYETVVVLTFTIFGYKFLGIQGSASAIGELSTCVSGRRN